MIKFLLLLLSLALVLQNTCPYGFAAKTAFVAPQTHDCPLKKDHHALSKEGDSVDGNSGKILFSAFVFSIPDVQTVILCSQVNVDYTPLSPDNYKNPFKEPSVKPPAA